MSASRADAPVDLRQVFTETLARCQPSRLIYDKLEARAGDAGFAMPVARFDVELAKPSRLWVFGAGKAVLTMAEGVLAKLGPQVAGGVLIAPAATAATGRAQPPRTEPPLSKLQPLRVCHGTHPRPTAASVEATETLLAAAALCEPNDHVIFLLSGGASALLCKPIAGLSVSEKAARAEALMRTGAPIHELNALRKQLSQVKGGRLAGVFRCPVTVLVLSDVVGTGCAGNDFATIGSGPLYAGERGPRHVLIADGAKLASIAATVARAAGASKVTVDSIPVQADVRVVAAAYAEWARYQLGHRREHELIVRYGEPIVRGEPGQTWGQGGRSQHLALSLARELAGFERWRFLAAGSDGIDGNTSAAGAIVDGRIWAEAQAAGLDPVRALNEFDSHRVLKALCALVETGPTGNNLNDLHLFQI